MSQLRPVSQAEKIIFPLVLCADWLAVCGCGAIGQHVRAGQSAARGGRCGGASGGYSSRNALINIDNGIFLGLVVGSKLSADSFLR